MRALIVDDDVHASKLLLKHLKKIAKFDVDIASSGQQAVEMMKISFREDYPFNLICLDIMMPGLDGHQTLTEIRKIEYAKMLSPEEGAKVMMISSLEDERNILKSFMELCDAYLIKPVTQKELFNKLQELNLLNIPENV